MNENTTLGNVSSWMRDSDAYDPSARERWFTFNGQRFTAHSVRAEGREDWPMTVREAVTGQYVATVSNWKLLPGQLAAALKAGA
jgi:hypothetical protein